MGLSVSDGTTAVRPVAGPETTDPADRAGERTSRVRSRPRQPFDESLLGLRIRWPSTVSGWPSRRWWLAPVRPQTRAETYRGVATAGGYSPLTSFDREGTGSAGRSFETCSRQRPGDRDRVEGPWRGEWPPATGHLIDPLSMARRAEAVASIGSEYHRH